MRIAFCIYGQIRDEHVSFPRIEAIARANGAKIFLSTWTKRGSKTTGALETSQLSRIFGPEVGYTMPRVFFDRLFEAFPTLDGELREAFSTAVTVETIASYLPDAAVEIEDGDGLFAFTRLAYSDVNSLRMLYKMWRSYLMMKAHERRTGERFDLIALFRPDVIPPEVVPGIGPGRLGVVQHHHAFIHDMFMLGESEAIDAMMGLFGKCAMNASRPWRGIHVELHDHAVESGLAPEVLVISAGITDSGETQATGRAILRRLLQEQLFDRSFQPRIDWDEVTAVLLQTIALADHGPPSLDELPVPIDGNVRSGHATEAAFSMIGFAAEGAARYDLAFLAETCRIVAAIKKDGLPALCKLRDWILIRWRELASRAGIEPHAVMSRDLDVARGDATTRHLDHWLARHLDASMRRIFETLIFNPIFAPPSLDELLRRIDALAPTDDRDAAEELASMTFALFPNDWRPHDKLGHYRSRIGDHRAALRCAMTAMDMEGTGSWGFNARIGRVHADLGELAEARRYLEIAAAQPGGDEAKIWLRDLPRPSAPAALPLALFRRRRSL